MRQGARRSVIQLLLLLVAAMALLSLLLVATGHAVIPALGALVRGSFGSWYAFTSATVVRMVPLAFTGLAVAVAFRAGILNIGAEGQLLVGGVAGGVWAAIAGWLRLRFGVLEVISTIMLNFLALYVTGWLVRGPLQEPTRINPQSVSLPEALHLPVLLSGTRLHAGVVLAVMFAIAVWWWLAQTASGFRLRAIGMNARAAASAGGVNLPRTMFLAFTLSGTLAGLGGAVEYTGITFSLYENFSPGYGYTAIAVALLARLHPIGVLGTALLFGALEAGANAMQRDAGVPSVVVAVVEATLILLVVAGEQWRSRSAAREIILGDAPIAATTVSQP